MNSEFAASSKEILIVDDTPANLRLLAMLLSEQGYIVRLAPNGNLAMMAIKQNLPDLILLDIRMPKIDGYEVCQRLKASDRTRDIPVIFLSALQEGEDKVKAFEVGGADYITKPFQPEEVSARVKHQLQLLDLQRQLQRQQQLLVAQNQQLQQEINNRKQAQAELSRERNLLRTLMDAIPDLICFKNPEGQYLLWNQAFQAWVGRPSQEILHQTEADLFSLEAAQKIQAKDQQVLTARSPLRYEESAFPLNCSSRSLDTYKIPVPDASGELLGIITVGRDITERKAAEERLNRTTSRLSTLIRNLQAGILVEDENRHIVLANEGFCDLFGLDLPPSELLGLNCAALAVPSATLFALPYQAMQRIDEILTARQPVAAEELVLADGRILERDYVPITSGDRCQGHLWQYRDITTRKANERALVKTSRALKKFSHNLKQLHRLSIEPFATFEDLFEDYLKTGCKIMKFSSGVIASVQQEIYTVQAIESSLQGVQPGYRCTLSNTLCLEAIQTQKTVAHEQFSQHPEGQNHPAYRTFQLESYITTPIFVNGQVYGSLCFFSEEIRTEGFKSHEKEVIELMAQSIGRFISAYQVEQQRHQAEIALRESETRFRQLAEHIDSVFWIWDPPEQRFTYVSPAYATIWGRSGEQILRQPQVWQSAIHPEDVDRMADKQRQGEGYDEEYRILRPDGSMRWLRDRAFPICDQFGQPCRVVGVAEDITDLKHQEQALRLIFEGTAAKTGSQFFHSLVRYLADVLQVRYALVTQILDIKRRRVKFLAFWHKGELEENWELELIDSPCEQVLAGETVYYPDHLQSHYPAFQAFVDWGVCSYFGVPLLNSGSEVIGHLAVLDDRPMLPEQPRELILKIFAARAGAELERQTFENEIQRARDSADAANRAKSEFLANISHELRTPLNSILGFTQLILGEGEIDAKTHEYLSIVYRSGEHLLALINDVLEMSKIEAGKMSLVTQVFDLHELLRSLQEMFSLRARTKNLALKLDCAAEVPRYIRTDESKLRQVLINLLSNAVKFTQQGQVSLRVTVATGHNRQAQPSAAVTIPSQSLPIFIAFAVADTGPGIAPEELKTLFNPFTQTTAGYQSGEGSGLGLSISQRFVQLMGGMIQVKSELNQGSTFSFLIEALPVEVAESEFLSPTQQTVQHLAPGQSDYRILVVEDQLPNRLLLVDILEAVGFTVRAVEDGLAAVEIVEDWQPHLIWMDIRMPNMDGYEATRRIRAARLSPSPIIIGLTANAFAEERSRVLAAGCNDFVRKPFQASQVFQMMAQYLSVQYLYRTDPDASADAASVPVPADVDWVALGAALPQQWLQDLKYAAQKGADDQILQMVTHLPPQASDLAATLTHWAETFQFKAILEILPQD